MPKINKNSKPKTKKPGRKPVFKFDMKKILEERKAESEKNLESCQRLGDINETVVLSEINNFNGDHFSVSPTLEEPNVIDCSNYNIPFDDNTNLEQSCLQRFYILSIEQNEFCANIHFNILTKANWSPILKNFEDILRGWHANFVCLNSNGPWLEHEAKSNQRVGPHNFVLVLGFIHHCVLNKSLKRNYDDLITLAKFMINMYLDPLCESGIIAIKKLFSTCIEIAFNKAKKAASIMKFAQELYSNRSVENLLDMVVGLFLPLKNCSTKTIYSYLSYTLFKSLLEKSNNVIKFSTDINDWFVQDLVDKMYFKRKPVQIVYSVIQLLEHVVVVFDLYKNEDKLSGMYDFLYSVIRQNGLSEAQTYVNTLDQWRLRLFGLYLKREYDKKLLSREQSSK